MFITDLPPSGRNTMIWVVVDHFSKMAHFVALPGLPSAPALVPIFVQDILRLHGAPSHIMWDRAVQFVSCFRKAVCGSIAIQLDLSSSYHPQSKYDRQNGFNQQLKADLRSLASAHHDDWSTLLP